MLVTFAGIPAAKRLIEGAGPYEHGAHIGDIAGVPAADVLIESAGPCEQALHISDVACVPMPDVLVEASGTLKHDAHVGNVRQIRCIGGRNRQISTTVKCSEHGCPLTASPLLNSQQLQPVAAVVKEYTRKASASTAIVFDADRIRTRLLHSCRCKHPSGPSLRLCHHRHSRRCSYSRRHWLGS